MKQTKQVGAIITQLISVLRNHKSALSKKADKAHVFAHKPDCPAGNLIRRYRARIGALVALHFGQCSPVSCRAVKAFRSSLGGCRGGGLRRPPLRPRRSDTGRY